MKTFVPRLSANETIPPPHEGFLSFQPLIERHAQIVFRHLSEADREEAVAEARAAGFVSYLRLLQRDKDPAQFPTVLASFAALHVKNGRHVGGSSSTRDVLSPVTQQRRHFAVQHFPQQEVEWNDVLVDHRLTPIPDQVAFKLDFTTFLQTLTSRDRMMAHLLSLGHSGKWVARRLKLSPGRVTQLRKQWCREWRIFIGELPAPATRYRQSFADQTRLR